MQKLPLNECFEGENDKTSVDKKDTHIASNIVRGQLIINKHDQITEQSAPKRPVKRLREARIKGVGVGGMSVAESVLRGRGYGLTGVVEGGRLELMGAPSRPKPRLLYDFMSYRQIS